jgi:hypothetical protein
MAAFHPLLKFKLGHYLRNLAQLTRYGNHQAAMPYCPHDQVPPAEPDHARRHERQPVALAQLNECHAPEFEIFIRDLEAGWKFGARGDGSRAPGFAPSEVRSPSSAGGLCQGQPLTWRRALSGPKPQGSRTPPAPPSSPRSAASAFSFPAPETNWTKLALKTLLKHEQLASPAPLLSTIPHGAVTWARRGNQRCGGKLIHPLIFRRRSFATVGTNFD